MLQSLHAISMRRHLHQCTLTITTYPPSGLLEWEAERDTIYHTEDSLKSMDAAGER